MVIGKFLFCGLYFDLFLPKTSDCLRLISWGHVASVSYMVGRCGCGMNYIELVGCSRLYVCDRLGKKIIGELRFRAKLYSLVYNETAGEICEAWRWGLSFVPGDLMCVIDLSDASCIVTLCLFCTAAL